MTVLTELIAAFVDTQTASCVLRFLSYYLVALVVSCEQNIMALVAKITQRTNARDGHAREHCVADKGELRDAGHPVQVTL